jgi:hypothetical protein
MTSEPPYLISFDFGANFVPVPEELWKYFGTQADSADITTKMTQAGAQAGLIDGTNMFGVYLIPLRNPDDVALWLDQGWNPDPRGSFLEFAGWLKDRETDPIPFIDQAGGTVLAASSITMTLVQWYWSVGTQQAATMRAGKSPLAQFLFELRAAERKWRRTFGHDE